MNLISAYAEQEFQLQKPPEDSKVSKIDHLKQVWRTTGKKPAELNRKNLPQHLLYVFDIFKEIKSNKPITFSEIQSWMNLTGNVIGEFEVSAIRKIDLAYLTTIQN